MSDTMEEFIRYVECAIPNGEQIKDFDMLKKFLDNRIKYWTLKKARAYGHAGRMKCDHFIGAFQTVRKMTFNETYVPSVTALEIEELMRRPRTDSDYDRLLAKLRKTCPAPKLQGRRRKKILKEREKDLAGVS
jgi:hypothetical protein